MTPLVSLLIGIAIGVCGTIGVQCVFALINVWREDRWEERIKHQRASRIPTVWERVRKEMLACRTDAEARAVYAGYLATEPHAASNMRIVCSREGDKLLDDLFFFLWELEPIDQ